MAVTAEGGLDDSGAVLPPLPACPFLMQGKELPPDAPGRIWPWTAAAVPVAHCGHPSRHEPARWFGSGLFGAVAERLSGVRARTGGLQSWDGCVLEPDPDLTAFRRGGED